MPEVSQAFVCCAHSADGFMALTGKKPDEDVFDLMNATDLNNKLRDLMDGLTVKVRCCSMPDPDKSKD